MTAHVEVIDPPPPREIIELVAADTTGLRVIESLVASDLGAHFIRWTVGEPRPDIPSPALVVVVASDDAADAAIAQLPLLRRPKVLSVAVVATSSEAPASLAHLSRSFDSVLRVPTTRHVSVVDALRAGVHAITAFAVADLIATGVDDVYPFYARDGGELLWSVGEGSVAADAAREACLKLAPNKVLDGVRILMHLDVPQDTRVESLVTAGEVIEKHFRIDDLIVSVSSTSGLARVSLILCT